MESENTRLKRAEHHVRMCVQLNMYSCTCILYIVKFYHLSYTYTVLKFGGSVEFHFMLIQYTISSYTHLDLNQKSNIRREEKKCNLE